MTKAPSLPSDDDFAKLAIKLASASNDRELFEFVVNAPFKFKLHTTMLSLGFIVLLLVNKKCRTIDRIAITDNELAEATIKMSPKKFEDIKIPVGYKGNIIAEAIVSGKPKNNMNWEYLFVPELTGAEARFKQAIGGIGYSAVYPFKARDGGAIIYHYFQYREDIGSEQDKFMAKYTQLVNNAMLKN